MGKEGSGQFSRREWIPGEGHVLPVGMAGEETPVDGDTWPAKAAVVLATVTVRLHVPVPAAVGVRPHTMAFGATASTTHRGAAPAGLPESVTATAAGAAPKYAPVTVRGRPAAQVGLVAKEPCGSGGDPYTPN